MKQQVNVFVILTGVSGNLGDAVIRRRVLEWSRGLGPIHAYVGNTTEAWVEQLEFRDGEAVYNGRKRRAWLKELLFGRGPRALVFDPGEVPLGSEHLKSELMFLGIVLALRLRGGFVMRPPRAVGGYSRATAALYRMSSRLSQVVLWRDESSLARIGVGELVPDTAFAEPAQPGLPQDQRSLLLVSMRGKRPLPPTAWFEGIREFARSRGLRIVAMSQVDEDEQRSRELAERFGGEIAEYRAWGDRSDIEQERAIRSLYEQCAYVVSDRLHVLILSAQAGAQPVEIAPRPVPKVATHFATVGLHDVSLDVENASADDVVDFLARHEPQRHEIPAVISRAREDLTTRIERARQQLVRA